LREQPKPPSPVRRPEKLERLNEVEAEIIQAVRACPTTDVLIVRDAVVSIVESVLQHHLKVRSEQQAPSGTVILLSDPLRKFR